MSDEVRIIKTAGKPTKKASEPEPVHAPIQKITKHRTFPKSALKKTRRAAPKIMPTSNPTKSPPVRREMLQVMTEVGHRRKMRGITQRIKKMSEQEQRKHLAKSGHPVSKRAPPELVADILAGGMESGMIPVP